MGKYVDLSDMLVGYYPQPKCPACGRFARKRDFGWAFSCSSWDGKGWMHD